MKFIFSLVLTALFVAPLTVRAEDAKIDFSAPPFWMFSYDEFQGLRDVQKKVYLNEFHGKARKLPSLSSLKQKEVDEAAGWEETWDSLMTKVYGDCGKKENSAICHGLEEVRFDVLDSYGNQKLENRVALEVEREKKARKKGAPEAAKAPENEAPKDKSKQ